MIDPYKMVYINIATSAILFFSVLFYKYVYPNRKISLLYLLILISLLPCISLLRPGAYESGDFDIHIVRSMDFFKNLMEGNLMPSWAPRLNAGYGYPLFTFNYTLPYYIISLIHFLGLSFVSSLKGFIFLNFIGSAIFSYKFGLSKFKNEISAFAVGVFFVFFPYHLVSTHFKVTIGEVLAYTLIPLLFLTLDKFIKTKKIYFLIATSFALGLIALSHIYIAIILIPIVLLYSIFYLGVGIKQIIYSVFIALIAALISLYQWAPTLIYKSILYTTYHPMNISTVFSPSILELLYSPWRYGLLFQGPRGEISYLIGYIQIFVICSMIFLSFKRKLKQKREIIFWLIVLIVLVFLTIPQSKFIWQYLQPLSSAGSQRLLILIGFVTTLFAGYFAKSIKNKAIIYLIIFIAISGTALNWGQRRVIPEIGDTQLTKDLSLSTSNGEAHFYAATIYQNPKNLWLSKIPTSHIQPNKDIRYTEVSRTSIEHLYKVKVTSKTIVKENTLYFPGWKVLANGKELSVTPDNNGVISFNLLKGKYTLDIKYEDLPIYSLTKIISVITLMACAVIILSYRRFHSLK